MSVEPSCLRREVDMWWIVLLAVLGIVFWMHYSQAMSVTDRVTVALDIVRTSEFTMAEGFDEAVREDPSLVGWVKSGGHCVMLFREEGQNGEIREIVDFASDCFHPDLIIHYRDGIPVKTDSGGVVDPRPKRAAIDLLRKVQSLVNVAQVRELEYDGCHY